MFQFRRLGMILAVLVLVAVSGWAGDIQNGLEPKGKAQVLVFEEELRLEPRSDDDHYNWPGEAVQVLPWQNGQFVVVLAASNTVYLYDAAGQFQRQFGGTGEGPGQFQMLRSFHVIGNKAVAFEGMGMSAALTYFDENLAYKERKMLRSEAMAVEMAMFSPDGALVAGSGVRIDRATGEYYNRMAILSPEFAEKKFLYEAKPTKGFDREKAVQPEYWVEFLAERFKPIALGEKESFAWDSAGNLHTSIAHTYKISVYDKNLKLIRTINKQFKPVAFPPEELAAFAEPMADGLKEGLPPQVSEMINNDRVNRAIQKAGFPPGKHPIRGLQVTGDNHLLVLTGENYIKDTTKVDLFSPAGVFLGQFERSLFEMEHITFKGDKAYAVVRDEDGENVIVRYKVKLAPAK